MKISLISTSTYPGDQGLRYVSSLLKKEGHIVKVIFLVDKEDYSKKYSKKVIEDLSKICKDDDLIGVSSMASTSIRGAQVIDYLKNILKKTVVWGGVHPTISPEKCIQQCDIICISEGEKAMAQLADNLSKGKDISKIENLWVKKDGEIIKNPIGALVHNLDELPYPDFDIEDHYISDGKKIRKFKEEDFRGMIFYQTERGCPNSCTYCINKRLKEINKGKGKILRTHSVDYVIKDLIRLKRKFKSVKVFDIRDETFFVRDLEYIRDFCKRYKSEVGLRWKCLGDPKNTSYEKLELCMEAGLTDIIIGIQGVERVNFQVYKRYLKDEHIIECAKIVNKFKDLAVMYDVITCNPYETKEDIYNMIRLLQKLPKPYFLSVNNLVFFLGSELYKKAREDGIVNSDKDSGFNLNYWDRWKHIKLKKKNEYMTLVINLMRGSVTKRRFGTMPNFILNKLIKNYQKEHKTFTHIVGPMVGLSDFFRENLLKPIYRSTPTSIQAWYDKIRYRV
jgi:anaerobic magnesium-protoporphyrin IX monomethyl ester cyclase